MIAPEFDGSLPDLGAPPEGGAVGEAVAVDEEAEEKAEKETEAEEKAEGFEVETGQWAAVDEGEMLTRVAGEQVEGEKARGNAEEQRAAAGG